MSRPITKNSYFIKWGGIDIHNRWSIIFQNETHEKRKKEDYECEKILIAIKQPKDNGSHSSE